MLEKRRVSAFFVSMRPIASCGVGLAWLLLPTPFVIAATGLLAALLQAMFDHLKSSPGAGRRERKSSTMIQVICSRLATFDRESVRITIYFSACQPQHRSIGPTR